MKTVMKLLAALTVMVMILGACGSSPSSKIDDLDIAIRDASDYLNDNIPKGSKIVILNIQSTSSDLSDYIIDELIANAVNDKIFSVVDRQQLDTIRAEQNFQFSGEVDDNSAMEIGKFFGAQSIVSGALSRLGNGYRIRIRALEVQTAQVQGQYNRNIASSSIVTELVGNGSGSSASVSTATASSNRTTQTTQTIPAQASAPATPVTPATPPAQTYRVGDTGPAGGLIFYDKGNNSGGWRYLEAAPVEAEFQAVWSVRDTVVENTQPTIGSGRRNTQLIVEKFRQIAGEWDTAAQKADDLVFGGFDDWFLPSKAELDQMYGNLKRRNLGDFKNANYSCSTLIDRAAQYQHFASGDMGGASKTNRWYVRPIRAF